MSATEPSVKEMQPTYSPYDDEIDLRKYLDILIAWWKEILLLGVVAAAAAGLGIIVLRTIATPQYEAKADIVMARLFSEIALDERVQISGNDLGGSAGSVSRRAALSQLVRSAAIAQAVADELGDLLTEEERDVSELLEMVSAETPTASDGRTASDLIRINVTADDPEKAAVIANIWAKHYIQRVNSIFGQAPAEVLESVQAELTSASATYQRAQTALQEYMADSPIETLQRQIKEKATLRDNLQLGRDEILDAIALQDRTARIQLFTDLTNAESQGLFSVLSEQMQARQSELDRLYSNRLIALHQLEQARNLQQQIEAGGDAAAATNHLVLQMLKTQVFAQAMTQPALSPLVEGESKAIVVAPATVSAPASSFVINADAAAAPAASEQAADAQAIVATLGQYIAELDVAIAATSQSMLDGEGYLFLEQLTTRNLTASMPVSAPTQDEIAQNELRAAVLRSYAELFEVGDMVQLSQLDGPAEGQDSLALTIEQLDRSIQILRAELAAEEAHFRLLMQQRDLAWNTFDALSNKAAELGLERSSSNSEVRMGSPAIPPSKPVAGPSLIFVPAVAGMIGLVLGVFVAFLAHYLGHAPFLRRQRTQTA